MEYLISFYQRDECFRTCLKDLYEGIKSVCPAFDMKERVMGERYVILIQLKKWIHEKTKNWIEWQVGKTLARFICDHLEPKWIYKMIQGK